MRVVDGATDQNASQTFCEFAATFDFNRLPPEAVHAAKRALLNYFGCAFAGIEQPALAITMALFETLAGIPRASIVGRDLRLTYTDSAFINAASANVLDFDDTHLPTIIHPTAPIAAPLFALAEQQRVSGRDLITAFVLGVDAACRIGNAVLLFRKVGGRMIPMRPPGTSESNATRRNA